METIKIVDKKNFPRLYEVFTFLFKAVETGHRTVEGSPLRGFYFDENKIITSDSRRLHIVEHDLDFSQGLFKVEKAGTKYIITEKMDGIFPNYRQIEERAEKSDYTYIDTFDSGNIDGSVSKTLFLSKVCLNYTFIKDIFFKGATWDFYCSDEATPVKFESQISSYKLTAYIMPIQIKGE